jgi:formate/nitrite transporter FocA (FNT family)
VADEQPAQKKRNDPTSQLARGELVHAEVKPLDLSGIPSVIAGIIAWAVAFVVVLIFRDELRKDGLEWWLWVTVAGFGLGLIGLVYCRRRWTAIQAGHRSPLED